jgi:serine/threonine-protein kinase RsbW
MLQVKSEVQSVVILEKYLHTLFQKYNIPESRFGDILISLTEALNNAIIHGNALDNNKYVHVSHTKEPNRIIFRIKDEGCGFNPDAVPDPTCMERIEECGGRGVQIMFALADHMCYKKRERFLELGFNI